MFGLVSVDIEYFNPVIVTLSSSDQKKNISLNCPNQTNPSDSPISLPIPQTAVGTDAVGPNLEMIEHNLNLKLDLIIGSILFYIFAGYI